MKKAPTKDNTFKNLQVLKTAQTTLRKQLGNKYVEKITPFFQVIKMVMKANNINEFEALKKIKETGMYKNEGAPLFFAAAVIEITEEKHFSELVKS